MPFFPLYHLFNRIVVSLLFYHRVFKMHFFLFTGDARVNEQVPLTSLHVAFARQHNRIESSLNLLNPHWSGERLYQETRRIISAQMQHIVFNELLPIILGRDLVSQFGLELEKNGFYNG